MWPKFGNSSISIRKANITSILYGFHKKTTFLRDGLDSGSIICDWHYDGLEILHKFGKKVKTKGQ